jgi:16S rRNA (guanine966-N2)-methyltransferase
VRVVAGEARGRRLKAKLPAHVRPTTDFVREAVFALLHTRVDLHGAVVWDLYCGSGAMGIEALSRGAASCTFVDDDAGCVAAARQNLDAVGLTDRTAAFSRARLPAGRPRGSVDVVLCDPPYGEVELDALLDGLDATLVVVESDRELVVPQGWEATLERRYGGTLVTMLQHDDGSVAS